jgi:hypothetical protein
MSHLTTSWAARDGSGPAVIAESHMAKPSQIVYFRRPGVSVINLGRREAGIFLRGDGTIVADDGVSSGPRIAHPVMTRATADEIAKTVLTKAFVKSVGGLDLVRRCACQYGSCGHCGKGTHGSCTTRVGFRGKPTPEPLTYLLSRSGAALVPVLPAAGPSCRWFCPCSTCAAKPADVPERRATAYRRATGPVRPGDTVWLHPATLGCPAICWTQPRATVVSLTGVYAVVKVDGAEHRIHLDNLRKSDPREATSRQRAPRTPKLPDGFTADPLF